MNEIHTISNDVAQFTEFGVEVGPRISGKENDQKRVQSWNNEKCSDLGGRNELSEPAVFGIVAICGGGRMVNRQRLGRWVMNEQGGTECLMIGVCKTRNDSVDLLLNVHLAAFWEIEIMILKDSGRHVAHVFKPLWRNRLARSAVNRKVGGSIPPRGVGGVDPFCWLWWSEHDYSEIPRNMRPSTSQNQSIQSHCAPPSG